MNNLNELLGNLSENVFKMISDGKNLDDIANELKIDKAWISMIVGNQSSDDQKVLDAIIIKNFRLIHFFMLLI